MLKLQKAFATLLLAAMVLGAGDNSMARSRENITQLPEAFQEDSNGILRLYNIFPRNYDNFDAMTADLERIRDMGFTHVWLNPLHLTTGVEKKDWPAGTPNGLRGSLYSMRDPYQFNPDFSTVTAADRANLSEEDIFERDKAALQRFTTKARELGMVPMFDLVLSHIAPDSKIVDGTHPQFQEVDTNPWVARYANGKPKRHGLDQDGNILPGIKYPDKEVWDDVVMLQYEKPEVRQQIIDHLWKPFVEMYLDLGFQGIRVDSVANNDPDVMRQTIAHFHDLHQEKYGVGPTILGESLGGTPERQARIQPMATHLYNSAYWVPNLTGPNMAEDGKDAKALWADPYNWFLTDMGQKQAIVFTDQDGNPVEGRKGGTVGYAGSHDELPWVLHFPQQTQDITAEERDAELFRVSEIDYDIDAKAAEAGLREKIAVAALASDGGWFLTSFDERLDTTLRSVFDKQIKGKQLGNLEAFVSDINATLAAQPENKLGSWAKRHFVDGKPELVIIERHVGPGLDGPSNLILANASPESALELNVADIQRIAAMTNRQPKDFVTLGADSGIWTVGGIQLPEPEKLLEAKLSFGDRLQRARESVSTQVAQK